MVKAYTLRPEYEGKLTGGTLLVGPDAAKTINIVEALQAGDGEIITGDIVEQAALENYYGAEGYVFSVAVVDGDKRMSIEVHSTEEPNRPIAPPPESRPPTTADSTVAGGDSTLTAIPNAQHGEGSEYQSFSRDELREIIRERGITGVPGNASKNDIISALESADEVETLTADQVVDQPQGDEVSE